VPVSVQIPRQTETIVAGERTAPRLGSNSNVNRSQQTSHLSNLNISGFHNAVLPSVRIVTKRLFGSRLKDILSVLRVGDFVSATEQCNLLEHEADRISHRLMF
jgi:hypothetical protein